MMVRLRRMLPKITVNLILGIIVILWVTPTLGLFINSIRAPGDALTSGWWTVFPHRAFVDNDEEPLPAQDICDANGGCTRDGQIEIEGVSATFEQWRLGIEVADDRRVLWRGNLITGRVVFQQREWALPAFTWQTVEELDVAEFCSETNCENEFIQVETRRRTLEEWQDGGRVIIGRRAVWEGDRTAGTIILQERDISLDLYIEALSGNEVETEVTIMGESSIRVTRDQPLYENFLNSLIVTIPATIIPVLIAAMAAYAFAWTRFRGRKTMYAIVLMLLVVPLQIALVPLLTDFVGLGINGTFLAVWIAHIGFGLPLATYLMYNYISQLPRETLESAFVDGASHFTIFLRIVLPLSTPAIVSFVVFQFLFVWNDYLVALIFLGDNTEVLTQQLVNFQGAAASANNRANLLPAAAFISFVVPIIVFIALQRYFVRGLLAGSVKG